MLGLSSAVAASVSVSRSVEILTCRPDLTSEALLQICFGAELIPEDMASLVRKDKCVFILTLYDIRLCPELFSRLDKTTVSYRIPGETMVQTNRQAT